MFYRHNHHQQQSSLKINLPIIPKLSSNNESDGEVEDDDDGEHLLNIDQLKEQNTTIFENDEQTSDDEQVKK